MEDSLQAWEINADFWDAKMGDESNFFHRSIVRPDTETLLNIKTGDYVLDIACGNGNFSQRLAEKGGFYEEVDDDKEKPIIIIVRLEKKS
jgi:2-polyprenyl-3-methyl-5-hydroxy-6-metoxy-1,4-benzoquinol methylase